MNPLSLLPHTVPWPSLQHGLLSDAPLKEALITLFFSSHSSALALLFHQSPPLAPNDQLVGCVTLSVGAALFFRDWLRRVFNSPTAGATTDFIGDSVRVTQTIPVHGLGRVQYRGAEWSARTSGGKTHKPGDGATIRRVEGIILVVE